MCLAQIRVSPIKLSKSLVLTQPHAAQQRLQWTLPQSAPMKFLACDVFILSVKIMPIGKATKARPLASPLLAEVSVKIYIKELFDNTPPVYGFLSKFQSNLLLLGLIIGIPLAFIHPLVSLFVLVGILGIVCWLT
jgi:hypothetical protein